MSWQSIVKTPAEFPLPPYLYDYQQIRENFSWEQAATELDGLPDGRGLNIAHEAVDRHALGVNADKVALRWLGKKGGERLDISYAELRAQSNRFANLLGELGIGAGERVFSLSSRVPELYFASFGTLKNRSVFCPLFAAFGPEPIAQRLQLGEGRVLVTSERLYRKKVADQRAQLPQLKYVLLTDAEQDLDGSTLALKPLLEKASSDFIIPPTDPEDMALLHFTSGTTGKPKGAVHVHQAVLMHYVTGKYVLDLHPQDIFWCTADCGWVTGTSYGMIAPLTHGVTNLVDEADFEAERWCRTLAEQQVSVWYTAPTAIRMLMRSELEPVKQYDLSRLRLVHSVGEPLNPEAVVWGVKALGLPIHDNWWQSETGGIMIANYAAMEVRPGSMGRPVPGVVAAIVRRDGDQLELIDQPDVEGELALKAGWPSMFRTYLNDEERYRNCFVGDWYLTGDLAQRDADGYFWFVGRADDIIKTAGHMVGPFEVESVLLEHPAVAEAGVIGIPEPTIGQLVKAFVALHPGYQESEELRRELLGFARKKLGSAVAPKQIAFAASLPKTRSGKIMRRLLKARELGLPEGDISTLEETQ